MAHTPGPWFASPVQQDEFGYDFCTVGPFDVSDRRDSNHYEDAICEVSGINHDAAANARLIAAAPELLDLARTIVAVCDSGNEELARIALTDTSPLIGQARELIRRIKGGA